MDALSASAWTYLLAFAAIAGDADRGGPRR
jgi:hypothetical protein